MKPSEIQVGKTYRNRGKGQTQRTVLVISKTIKPHWFGRGNPPSEPGVRFIQEDANHYASLQDCLYLSSFAAWAGSEVME